MKNIIKTFLFVALYFILIYFLDFKIFNRFCDLTDIIGYSFITDFIRFFSNHFIFIANIVTVFILAIFFLNKKYKFL